MIHRIQIQNFKSLRNVTVDLSPVTVLIGKSGTGKTNFVSAIQFLKECLLSGPAVAAQKNPTYKCALEPRTPIRFTVVFDVPGFDDRFTYTCVLSDENLVALEAQTESLKYRDITVHEGPGTCSGERRGRDFPRMPSPGELALGYQAGSEESQVAFLALTEGIGVYAFSDDVLTRPQPSASRSGLADDGQNFLEVVKKIILDSQSRGRDKAIAASLQRVNDSVTEVQLDAVRDPRDVVVYHKSVSHKLPLRLAEESNGFRRFYAYLLALHQMPPKQTLVFEEPENGIYPGALSLLADEFKAAPEAGRGQVLLTTHSPALLDHFSDDQIRVVELVDLETQIGPLAAEQRDLLREELLHPGELLTVDTARRQGQ